MIGRSIGSYEVVAKLGEGGMGEVYRAHDSKLDRDVAIKIIPPVFASDAERLTRFRREAKVLAALNHPNIGQIYGVEETGEGPALILELVEGPTLAGRIAAGPLDIGDALQIARQIALALEAAHAQGIIHRDLKPANVKVRDDGSVKVLDFGLAKALESQAARSGEAANSPTITNRATVMDVILGTAAYMAPEQAKGRPADKRADIWAFGVVLFEMLAGRRLFRGEAVTDTLAEVLKSDPDWNALPRDVPPAIRRLLRRCLERDPNKRLHDAADARLEIEEALVGPGAAPDAQAGTPGVATRERLVWLVAIVATAVVAVVATRSLNPKTAGAPETRLQIVTGPGTPGPLLQFALSPDGRTLAYWMAAGTKSRIWLRPLGSDNAHELQGSETVTPASLVWSPDGRSIFYVDSGVLREVAVDGSGGQSLPLRFLGFGFTRNAAGTTLIAPANASPLARLPAQGGKTEPATRVTPPQMGHRYPLFLPDGRRFLLLVTGPPGVQGIYHGSLDSLDVHRIVDADTAPVFLGPDVVVFGRQDSLFGQKVNVDTLAPMGEPTLIAGYILQNRGVFGTIALSASASGTLAYRPAESEPRRLVWRDRSGTVVGTVGEIDTAEGTDVRLSPDERTIAVNRRLSGNADIWTIPNTPQGAWQRVTFDAAMDTQPVWSPDSLQIAYQSSRRGGGFYDLYRRPIGGEESVLLESAENKTMNDWSRDNKYVLFVYQSREQVARDLWALPLDGKSQPFAVTKTPADETGGRLSSDSRWVAYQSNAAGAGQDVYVRRFPESGREYRISPGGGTQPRWRDDGKELYYIDRQDQLVAVAITTTPQSDTLEHGAPVRLFRLPANAAFAPSRDGKRFIVNEPLENAPILPVTIVLNWRPR